MMKNARDMYSKKTLNNENHTKTVWKFPQTQAATSLAKSKPATLVKHCCDDLEHRTTAPLHYIIAPHTCTIVPPTSCHCTIYIAPLHPLHRTIVPPTLYHWTPYTVPLYPLHRTIAPPTWYHCAPYIVPLYPLRRTIVYTPCIVPSFIIPLHPLHRTSAPAISYHCALTSYHCTRYIVPLYRLHRAIVPASPYHCAVFTAPSHLHFGPPYLRLVPLDNHRTYLETTSQSSSFENW